MRRLRLPRPTPEEIAVGKRMREVRIQLKFSQDSTARQIGLSRDQLNRIERGQVAVRFFPGWHFCQLTNMNPLWLAFGGAEERTGFQTCGNAAVPYEAPFFETMVLCSDLYRKCRESPSSLPPRIATGAVFIPERLQHLSGGVIVRVPGFAVGSGKEAQKILEHESRKQNLRHVQRTNVGNWAALRELLRLVTARHGEKASVARRFKITTQAVSQWLSGKTMPSADTALQLRAWLLQRQNLTTERADRAATRPTRTRKSESTKYEKPQASPKKKH
jgi:transcriptional regulator with XRE-family HTH domain